MATKFDSYESGDDDSRNSVGIVWIGQYFTASANYTITSVKMKLFRGSGENPGTRTMYLKAADGDGKPTSSVLASGTYNASTLVEGAPGGWFEISLGAGAELTSGNRYAFYTDCHATFEVAIRFDGSSPTYANGSYVYSANEGSVWSVNAGRDCMFSTWGDPIVSKRGWMSK